MRVGTIEAVRRYPVKSMAGESLESAELTPGGLAGDRAWAVRDEVRGGIRGAKKLPALMTLEARYPGLPASSGSSPAEITFADGSRGSTSDADINEQLSRALDHPVSLWPLLPADALDHYRRGAPSHDDIQAELRSIFGREPGEPLPDITKFPPELMQFESPPGTYFDAFPLMLMTAASLDTMQERVPESAFDLRRFRPNFLVSETSSSDPFPELAWLKRHLRVGEATLEVSMECPRCVMVTHAHGTLPRDPGIMRALVREASGSLGVYATVVEPGRVRAGDAVELLD